MAPRASWVVLEAIAEPIGAHIRTGAPKAVIIGSLTGLALGVIVGLTITTYLLIPGALLGALIGAMIGASVVKAPPPAEDAVRPPGWMGNVRLSWTHKWKGIDLYSLVVACDNGLCVFMHSETKPDWDETLSQLAGGFEPTNVTGAQYIPLADVMAVESPRNGSDLNLRCESNSASRRECISMGSVESRTQLLDELRVAIGSPIREEVCDVGWLSAIAWPAILTTLIAAATWGLYVLADRWTQNPPPPPRGKDEQDPLVWAVISVGPANFAYIGGAAALLAAGWTIKRALSPPQFDLLVFRDEKMTEID